MALVLGAAGCAFPQGSTQGDPLLGNFNRPFVATPPPERGGLGADSPAYDGGARIGLSSPDVPSAVENSSGFLSLPTLTSPNLLSGLRLPFGVEGDGPFARRPGTATGARLPMADGRRLLPVPTASAGPMAVVPRPSGTIAAFTSGASIAPAEVVQPVQDEVVPPSP